MPLTNAESTTLGNMFLFRDAAHFKKLVKSQKIRKIKILSG